MVLAVKKYAKVDINFPGFLYFVPNILCGLSEQTNFSSLIDTASSSSSSSFFPIFNKNIKQLSCVKVSNLMVLCKQYERFQLYFLVFFLIELTFWSRMSASSYNLNHDWKCRAQKKKFFQTILAIALKL